MNQESYLKKFRVAKANPTYEKAKLIADTLYLSPGLIMRVFKEIGEKATHEISQESRGHKQLFMYLYKKQRDGLILK